MKENAIINIKKLHIPHRSHNGQDKKGQTPSDWNNAIQCAKDEAKRDKENELPDDGSYTQSQIDEVDDIIKKVMDKNLNDHRCELQGYIDRKKHQQFIVRWSQLMENSVLDAAEIYDKLESKRYQGHGQVNVKAKKITHSGMFNRHTNKMETKTREKDLERMKRQARRLTAILQLEDCVLCKANKEAVWYKDINEQLANIRGKFLHETDRGNGKEIEAYDKVSDGKTSRMRRIIETKKLRQDYDKMISHQEEDNIRKVRKSQANLYVGQGSHGRISRATKGPMLQPLKVFEIPGQGRAITTDESMIDKIARNAWKKIFDGNIKDQDMMVKNFFKKYRVYIFKGKNSKSMILIGEM